MKYIKSYENIDKEYYTGDYIKLNQPIETGFITRIIAKFIPSEFKTIKKDKSEYKYLIDQRYWVNEWEIDRKATTEEIEEYLINQNIIKYNL